MGLWIDSYSDKEEALREYFDQLELADSTVQISLLYDRIWAIWMEHPDDLVRKKMKQGAKAMAANDYSKALAIYDEVIAFDTTYPEGWNKRSTVNFLNGQYNNALKDAEETLALEPRHFGALSGIISVQFIIGDDKTAYKYLMRLKALIPQDPELEQQITLMREVLGLDGGGTDQGPVHFE